MIDGPFQINTWCGSMYSIVDILSPVSSWKYPLVYFTVGHMLTTLANVKWTPTFNPVVRSNKAGSSPEDANWSLNYYTHIMATKQKH